METQVITLEEPKAIRKRDRVFPPVDAQKVRNVRQRFLDMLPEMVDDFEPEDIDTIKNDDWPVYRYVSIQNGDEDKALDQLITSYRWRKTMGIRNLDPGWFPDLIWRCGPLFLYEPDKKGRPTMYSRCKFVLCVKEITKYEQLFTAYQTWHVDEAANGGGWTLILDFAGTGLRNTDFDLLKFFLNLLMVQFPRGIEYILVINLPFILRVFWGLVKTWIPSDRVDMIKFVDSESILEYIDKDKLPDFLGGTCQKPHKGWKVTPKNCPDVFEFGEKVAKITRKRCEEIYKLFEPLINEGLEDEIAE